MATLRMDAILFAEEFKKNLKKMLAASSPCPGCFFFLLNSARQATQTSWCNWQDLGTTEENLLEYTHKAHVSKIRSQLEKTLSKNLHRDLDMADAYFIRGVVEELQTGNVSSNEIGFTSSGLTYIAHSIENGDCLRKAS